MLGNVVISNLRFVKRVGIGDSIQVRLTGKRKIDRNRKDANGRRACDLGRGSEESGQRTGRQRRHPDAGVQEGLNAGFLTGKPPAGDFSYVKYS